MIVEDVFSLNRISLVGYFMLCLSFTFTLSPVLPDWAGFEFDCAGKYWLVRVNIGLGGWTKFELVFGQFGGFQNI